MTYTCNNCGGPILAGQASFLISKGTGAQHDGCPHGPMGPPINTTSSINPNYTTSYIPVNAQKQAQEPVMVQIAGWVPYEHAGEVLEAIRKAKRFP